jgi:predicted RecA/RadA family phage recombinase
VPKATNTASTGETSNVDNRYQTITISSTTSVAAGDAFTIANCNSVHLITKGDTGQLMTFRVISVPSATTLVMLPADHLGAGADLMLRSSTRTARSLRRHSNAAITFLNTVDQLREPVLVQGQHRNPARPLRGSGGCRQRP